ncbi:MAG: haloacid dehalogenase [Chloroflexi bacterium]|nr:haloacid dehalogenase [Chloroflexota bacterium]
MSGLGLDGIEAWARTELDGKNAAREQALRWSRELVRTCANSIRAVHRHEFDSAEALIGEAHALNDRICATLAEHADLYWAGYVQDAQKELAEACCTLALANRCALPDPSQLGIAPAAFLNGMGEAVGEARRYVLDLLRRGEADGCEWLLGAMDEIYGLLVTMDYPDALTGGLRRTTDNTRGILEKTRGDLTLALRQEALVTALRAVEQSVGDG